MLSAEDIDICSLFEHAKTAQMPRNGIINLLSLDVAQMDPILVGCFVRVLLELQDKNEDYLLARIDGVEAGEESYSGFSQYAQQRTNILLRLQLPQHLAGINGQLYQLNSISNTAMTKEEFTRWGEMTRAEFALPTVLELHEIAQRISPYATKRVNPPREAPAAPGAAAQPLQPQATVMNSRRDSKPAMKDDDLPTKLQLQHQVVSELREHNALFQQNIDKLNAT